MPTETPATPPGASARPAGSDLLASTVSLARGTVIAQLIVISLIPVITRLYPPDAYGAFAIFLSVSVIVTGISNLRYRNAMLLELDDRDADAVGALCLLLVLAIVAASALALALAGESLAHALGVTGEPWVLYAVPVAVLLGGTHLVLEMWALRGRAFPRMARAEIATAASDRIVTIALGALAAAGPAGLVIGHLAGRLAALGALLPGSPALRLPRLLAPDARDRLPAVARRHRRFPAYAWSALLMELARQAPVLVLGALFGPAVAAFFALARRVLLQPIVIVGNALAKSFHEDAARRHRAGEDLAEPSTSLFRRLLLWAGAPAIVVAAFAPEAFGVVFGERWTRAGDFARWLTPLFVARFAIGPLGRLFDVLGKQREHAAFSVVYLCAAVGSLLAGALTGSDLVSVALFAASVAAVLYGRVLWLLSELGVTRAASVRTTVAALARGVLFALPLVALRAATDAGAVTTLVAGMVCLAAYWAHLLALDPQARARLRPGLGRDAEAKR